MIDTKALRELCERASYADQSFDWIDQRSKNFAAVAALKDAAPELLDGMRATLNEEFRETARRSDTIIALRERLRAAEELVALVRSRVSISQFGPVKGGEMRFTEQHVGLLAKADRARELGEWLRGMSVRGGKGVVNNVDARSLGRVAETLESLLAENERLRATLMEIEKCVGPFSRDRIALLEGRISCMKELARAATKAEPESDPGFPAGSSTQTVG